MSRPFLVFQNLATTRRGRLFPFPGVDWLATPWAWVGPFFFLLVGLSLRGLVHAPMPWTGGLARRRVVRRLGGSIGNRMSPPRRRPFRRDR